MNQAKDMPALPSKMNDVDRGLFDCPFCPAKWESDGGFGSILVHAAGCNGRGQVRISLWSPSCAGSDSWPEGAMRPIYGPDGALAAIVAQEEDV